MITLDKFTTWALAAGAAPGRLQVRQPVGLPQLGQGGAARLGGGAARHRRGAHQPADRRAAGGPAGSRGREAEVEELYDAVVKGRPVFHGGRWGAATLEVVH